MSAHLRAEALTVEVGGKTVCRGLEIGFRPGERWAVLGPNGSGKSTLLHTLAGLRPPAAGRVLLDGVELKLMRRRAIARRLGLLLQQEHDPFPATVLETVLAGRHPHLGPWEGEGGTDRTTARAALAAVELTGFEGRSLTTLSGGERRRVGLATLFCQDPQLMLLDEPTDQLDLRHQARLLRGLDGLAEAGRTVIMVLHDPTLAVRHADGVILLHEGGEAVAGAARELLTEARLTRLYGYPLFAIDHPSGPAFLPGR